MEMIKMEVIKGYAVGYDWKEGKEKVVSMDNCKEIRFFETKEEAESFAETVKDGKVSPFKLF